MFIGFDLVTLIVRMLGKEKEYLQLRIFTHIACYLEAGVFVSTGTILSSTEDSDSLVDLDGRDNVNLPSSLGILLGIM